MIQVLKRPILTEKAMKHTDKGQYVFEVLPSSNKIEIKKAIEEMFEVNVKSVRTANIKGKVKKRFTKTGLMSGRTKLRKKAYITLNAGQSIEIVAGINK